jgi:hypothetical protein
MKKSEQINELAAAMAKAQPAFETASKDHKAKVETRTGGSYEFNYADFAAYLEVCRKPLGEHGLSFIQEAVTKPQNEVAVTTLLMHTSGQWIETDPLTLPLIPDSRGAITAQIIGSGITYAKRYSLSSLIGLASEGDDDGNAASGNAADIAKRERPPCPNCGKTEHVIKGKEEFGGGWLCWKNKGGCGEKWQDIPAEPLPAEPEAPKAKGKSPAKQVAEQHGMKTADELPGLDAYHTAIAKVEAAVRARDPMAVAKIVNYADGAGRSKLSESEHTGLMNECTLALKKIKAAESEPVEAAA